MKIRTAQPTLKRQLQIAIQNVRAVEIMVFCPSFVGTSTSADLKTVLALIAEL